MDRAQFEKNIVSLLLNKKYNFVCGVPCGVQKHIIECFKENSKMIHLPTTRESEAIGICAGASLAGKKPVVYMQNSGLMNSINDITSLLLAYRIPILLLVSWRGAPGEDAPQHYINGRVTFPVLKLLKIPFRLLDHDNMVEAIDYCDQKIREKKVAALIIERKF